MDEDRIVVDASVALKWFRTEDGTVEARELLKKIEQREIVAFVPDLILYEVANAWVLGMGQQADELERIQTMLINLPWVVNQPTTELLTEAGRFAREHAGVSVYDAVYVTLAMYENAVVVTADKKLSNKIQQAFIRLL